MNSLAFRTILGTGMYQNQPSSKAKLPIGGQSCVHPLPGRPARSKMPAADEMVPDRDVLVSRKEGLRVAGHDCRSVRPEASATKRQRVSPPSPSSRRVRHQRSRRTLTAGVPSKTSTPQIHGVAQKDVIELRPVHVNRPAWHAVALGSLKIENGSEGRVAPDVVTTWLHHPTFRGQYLGEGSHFAPAVESRGARKTRRYARAGRSRLRRERS